MNVMRIGVLLFSPVAAFAAQHETAPARLSDLVEEAVHSNPDIIAAVKAWQAAAQVPSQVSTLPDPQVTIQEFSVGSPRPFAGFTNSNFAYIGFGISQDLPYPGKLKLIATGFGEAATAVNQAVHWIYPDKKVNPGHSSNMAIFGQKDD